jgi:His-Xaa-Ser system protein HxsD
MLAGMGEAAEGTRESIPGDVLGFEVAGSSVHLQVEATSHPIAAICGAAFVFVDRCWVLLDRPDTGHVRVTLAARKPAPPDELEAMAREFAEELVSNTWRAAIENETRGMLVNAVSRAHAAGDNPPTLDDLANYEFTKDAAMDDPLGIAMSWEEKHAAGGTGKTGDEKGP